MKEIKSAKKTSVLKKFFIKICRLLGYELIDQSTLEFPVSNKNYSSSVSIPGKKSLSLGSGETLITRKVEGIEIIIKTCTSVQLVSQNKKRIFEKDKSEYTFRTVKSLCRSAEELRKKFPNISIEFIIIDIGSPQSDLDKIISFFPKQFKIKLKPLNINKLKYLPKTIDKNNERIERNMSTTMASIHESFVLAKNCRDLVYFVEDDYIHKPEALTEMVFSYEKFSSIFQEELILLSTDYPYLYKKLENSNILIGENFHWRTVRESLLTFMTSKKMIEKHYEKLIDMSMNESNPFEKNLHKIYEDEICLSPLPSLSIHCANINSVFGLSPNVDLKKLWDNYEN